MKIALVATLLLLLTGCIMPHYLVDEVIVVKPQRVHHDDVIVKQSHLRVIKVQPETKVKREEKREVIVKREDEKCQRVEREEVSQRPTRR